MKRIDAITIKTLLDDSPDLSYLGEYTDTPEPWAIERRSGQYVALLPKNHEFPQSGPFSE